MAAAKDPEALRLRAINHMNKDHTYDLKLYLRHYYKLPKSLLNNPSTFIKLTELENSHISVNLKNETEKELQGNGKTYDIPFHPPMNNLGEARIRLVRMTRVSLEKTVGYQDVIINKWVNYTFLQWVIFSFVLLGFAGFSSPNNFSKDLERGWVRRYIFLGNDTLGDFFEEWSWVGWWGMIGIHAFELVWFLGSRILRYRVGSLWVVIVWVVDCWVGGLLCMRKFDGYVEGRREALRKEE